MAASLLVPSLQLSRELEQHVKRQQKSGTAKHAWADEEDAALLHAVQVHGQGQWALIAREVGTGRSGKQCRERFCNHLDPTLSVEPWSLAEDELLLLLRANLGNKWAVLATALPGRSPNTIKNRWNSHLRRRVARHDFDYLDLSYASACARVPNMAELNALAAAAEQHVSPRKRARQQLQDGDEDEDMMDSDDMEISPRLEEAASSSASALDVHMTSLSIADAGEPALKRRRSETVMAGLRVIAPPPMMTFAMCGPSPMDCQQQQQQQQQQQKPQQVSRPPASPESMAQHLHAYWLNPAHGHFAEVSPTAAPIVAASSSSSMMMMAPPQSIFDFGASLNMSASSADASPLAMLANWGSGF